MAYTLSDLTKMKRIMPKMTGATTDGFTVTDSGYYNDYYGWKLFDQSSISSWFHDNQKTKAVITIITPREVEFDVLRYRQGLPECFPVKTIIRAGTSSSNAIDQGTFTMAVPTGVDGTQILDLKKKIRGTWFEFTMDTRNNNNYVFFNELEIYLSNLNPILLEIDSKLYTITMSGLELISQTVPATLETYTNRSFDLSLLLDTIIMDGKVTPIMDIIRQQSSNFKIHALKN